MRLGGMCVTLEKTSSQSVTTTLLAGSTWPTLTLYSGLLFQVCGGYLCIFQCIFQCIFFFLLEGRRTSGWSSAPFTIYLSSCWRRSCRERTSVMNGAPAGSCDPTRRGRTPLGRRNHRPRGPNHPPLSPHLRGDPNR